MNACSTIPPGHAERYQVEHCDERFETPAAEVERTGFALCPICATSLKVEWLEGRG